MLTAGVLKLNAEGRVLIALDSVMTDFNGGSPLRADGLLLGADAAVPEVYIEGFGYLGSGAICVRALPPLGGGLIDPLRDEIGNLALALTEPIVGFTAGCPIVADGRLACALAGPPPLNLSAFTGGFQTNAFF